VLIFLVASELLFVFGRGFAEPTYFTVLVLAIYWLLLRWRTIQAVSALTLGACSGGGILRNVMSLTADRPPGVQYSESVSDRPLLVGNQIVNAIADNTIHIQDGLGS
jgi:hypothetical protein